MVILWWRDSLNAISWVAASSLAFNEIKALASLIHVVFRHVGRAANALVDLLAKQGGTDPCLSLFFLCNFFSLVFLV